MSENGRQDDIDVRLFETKAAKGKAAYSFFVVTVFVSTVLIWVYRLTHFPESGRWAYWLGMFISELSFAVYWIFTLSPRFNVVHRFPFKDRLSLRYHEKRLLPDVDVFVCTADHTIEPPKMVIDTVLSAMSFNYPQEKLSVYLSDDGCSEFMFYALLEASEFARYWVPFCKEFKVEPRAPAAYFSQYVDCLNDDVFAKEWNSLKKLYEDMNSRIEQAIQQGYIPKEVKEKHKGFLEWRSRFPRNNHQSIVQIITDGRNRNSVDIAGHQLPTLVYVSREKRPHRPHNFKAGALNTLIRVSSEISNAPIILLLDCDMYSNDPDALQDSLCFLMDETQGQDIAFVQYPQRFHNLTKNDIYANLSKAITQIEMAGLDGCGTTLFSGTGCFHRRSSLYGHRYSKDNNMSEFNMNKNITVSNKTVEELENKSMVLANCEFEDETQWGKEMGMVYGLPVEDIVTGLAIQCRGWRSVYYNPSKYAFVGNAPTSLDISLVQYKRWFEGLFEVFASKYCPFIYGHGKIKLSAQMGYCTYLLCAPLSLPTLFYLIVPGLSLIHNIPLFPKVSSLWFVPFAYVFVARNAFNLYEALGCGDTLKSWLNQQRMWMFRNTTSYVFAFIDLMKKVLGFSETTFVITAKVVDEDMQKQKRCEDEMLEFGSSSIMFTMISTLALFNLVCFTWGIFHIIIHDVWFVELYGAQMVLCGLVVMINLPVYQALLLRRDNGRLPFSVLWKSTAAASLLSVMTLYS